MHFVGVAAVLAMTGALSIRGAHRGGKSRAARGGTAGSGGSLDVVTVRTSDLDGLRAGFEAAQKRQPTPAELADLVEGFVNEEVLYREGMARGLDRGDLVVRRRVIDRMTEIARPHGPDREPTRAELEAWFTAFRHRFVRPATVTVEQIFVDPGRHQDPRADATRILTQLEQGHGAVLDTSRRPAGVGDATLLPGTLTDTTALELSHLFGGDFASRAMAGPIGRWQGPVWSPRGIHLLRVHARHAERVPTFAEAERYVRADWLTVERRGTRAAAESLRPHYRVVLPPGLRGSDGKDGSTLGPGR